VCTPLNLKLTTTATIDEFDDATAIMPDYFAIGTMKGSFIHKLSSISERIMKQILHMQLRVPKLNENQVTESSTDAAAALDGDGDDDDDEEKKEALIDFSRPSDYRTKAIEAKHTLEASRRVVDDARIASRLSTFDSTSVAESAPFAAAKSDNVTSHEG